MSEEENIHDLIDQYLRGELERDELDRFRNRMRHEPDFAREVELHRSIVEGVRKVREKELKDYLRENAKVEYIGNIWGSRWLYASAAIIVVMVGMFFFIKKLDTGNQLAQDEQSADEVQKEILKPQNGYVTKNADTDEVNDTTAPEMELPQLVVVEDGEEMTLRSGAVSPEHDMSKLGEEERILEGDQILDSMVKTDELIASINYTVTVISSAIRREKDKSDTLDAYFRDADSKAVTVTTTDESKSKKGRLFRKSDEEDAKPESEVASEPSSTAAKITNRPISVQFWSSPVNFKGYKYNGQTLLLYGVDPSENIEFKEYGNQLYLKRGNQYYIINLANDYKKFTRLTNTAVIKELNR